MIVRDQDMEMTRGDSETITVTCEDYPFEDGDVIEFTVRSYSANPRKLIYKKVDTFEDGAAIIRLAPEDTSPLAFGKKTYDIQWTRPDGSVTTIIKAAFIIGEEVTYD